LYSTDCWIKSKREKPSFRGITGCGNCSALIETSTVTGRKHFKQNEAESHSLLLGRFSAGSCALCCQLEHSGETAVRNSLSTFDLKHGQSGTIQGHLLTWLFLQSKAVVESNF